MTEPTKGQRYYAKNKEKAKESSRRWHEANKEKAHARMRRYDQQFPEKKRARHLARKYGLTLRGYDALSVKQNHACLICGIKAGTTQNRLRVDHDHTTGFVRGLLCDQCNTALGGFRDNEGSLHAAIQYLAKGRKTMSDFTFADHKLGGRLTACCEAIGAGHLRRAAGIFNEVADDLNSEAEATSGLLAPNEDDWSSPMPAPVAAVKRADPADLQMCARNVHSYSAPDPVSGWRTCSVCGNVNVAPPGGGPVDMSTRPVGEG